MRKLFSLLGLAGVGLLIGNLALAQVNVVPQVGVVSGVVKKATYSSTALALAPAASATDIACIAGSATKVIRVTRIGLSGTAGTAVSAPFTLLRRATADTGGTAGTTTANLANNIAKMDTSIGTQTATLISYTANPTINDTSPTYIRSSYLSLPLSSTAATVPRVDWVFGGFGAQGLNQEIVLRGAAQQMCINLNSVSVSSGVLHIDIEWTEE